MREMKMGQGRKRKYLERKRKKKRMKEGRETEKENRRKAVREIHNKNGGQRRERKLPRCFRAFTPFELLCSSKLKDSSQ